MAALPACGAHLRLPLPCHSIHLRARWFSVVPDMMFGFGDVETPMQSTVDIVEDVVVSYLRDLIQNAA
eukprot:SAG31_NODE_18777_length_623_cov_0.853053_2_plen_67_part_01